ncbi:MAG: DNA alkylation repair enzyme superfamily, partial [candidate division TA06 bacterium 34_109]
TLEKLISSKYHEVRFLSLNILVLKYEKNIEIEKDILDFYLRNVKYVNNWDLVDTSSYKIVGRYSFENKDKSLIKKFSRSDNIWERRIAVVSLYYFIKRKDCSFPLSVLKRLLNDREELLKKAIGWMLREICKNCGEDILEKFLIENYNILAPITVSYATERFSKEKRKRFLKGYRKKLHKH